jgi:hypothetical protein
MGEETEKIQTREPLWTSPRPLNRARSIDHGERATEPSNPQQLLYQQHKAVWIQKRLLLKSLTARDKTNEDCNEPSLIPIFCVKWQTNEVQANPGMLLAITVA